MVDTTVLVAGTVWPRWPYEVLQHALRGDFRLLLSTTTLEESRRTIGKKFPAYNNDFETFLKTSSYQEVPDPSVQEVRANLDLMGDKTDIPIALAGILSQVDWFVSEDKDFTKRTVANSNLHARLNIILSGTFLREVMGWTSEELERIRKRTWEEVEEDG